MIAEFAARVRENVQKVIVGKAQVIDLALVAILWRQKRLKSLLRTHRHMTEY